MALPFLLKPSTKNGISIKMYDGTSTPKTITIKYFSSVPELAEAKIVAPLETFLDRNVYQGMYRGADNIEMPEVTFEVDAVDDQVTAGVSDLRNWFQLLKDSAAAALATTSVAATKVRAEDGSEKDANLPADMFTLGLKILFTGDTGKTFGYDFPNVRIVNSSFKSDDIVKFSFTVQICCTATAITTI
jgi:hypothetical protein